MLGNIGKDAGAAAAKELHDAIDGAIPAAEEAVKSISDRATYSLAGLVADVANRLNGARLPVDITITATVRISGQVGDLKLSVPDYEVR